MIGIARNRTLMGAPWRLAIVVAVTAALCPACCCLPAGKTGEVSGQGHSSADAVHVAAASPEQATGTNNGTVIGNKVDTGDKTTQKPEAAPTQTGIINLAVANASTGGWATAGGLLAAALWLWRRARYWYTVLVKVVQEIEKLGDEAKTLKATVAKLIANDTIFGRLVQKAVSKLKV